MIVKVQRPLAGSPTGDTDILVYDEHRKHAVVLDPDALPDWLIKALETTPKVFVVASWKQGHWKFTKPAKHQSW